MLVVRRRAGEAIVVNGEIEIEVMEISRTRVRLGVRAPREVSVARREALTLATENREAAAMVSEHGADGVGDLLRLLRNLSAHLPQAHEEKADT